MVDEEGGAVDVDAKLSLMDDAYRVTDVKLE